MFDINFRAVFNVSQVKLKSIWFKCEILIQIILFVWLPYVLVNGYGRVIYIYGWFSVWNIDNEATGHEKESSLSKHIHISL